MLRIIVNGNPLRELRKVQEEIFCLEIILQLSPIVYDEQTTKIIARYLWGTIQGMEERGVIIYNGIIMGKSDVDKPQILK